MLVMKISIKSKLICHISRRLSLALSAAMSLELEIKRWTARPSDSKQRLFCPMSLLKYETLADIISNKW